MGDTSPIPPDYVQSAQDALGSLKQPTLGQSLPSVQSSSPIAAAPNPAPSPAPSPSAPAGGNIGKTIGQMASGAGGGGGGGLLSGIVKKGIEAGATALLGPVGGMVAGGAMGALGGGIKGAAQGVAGGAAGLGGAPTPAPTPTPPPTLSDEREKTRIRPGQAPVESCLDKLRAHEYRYKHPEQPGAAPGQHVSVMAQELEKAGPVGKSMVEEDAGGNKMVNYSRGLATMLAAQTDMHHRLKKLEGAGPAKNAKLRK